MDGVKGTMFLYRSKFRFYINLFLEIKAETGLKLVMKGLFDTPLCLYWKKEFDKQNSQSCTV